MRFLFDLLKQPLGLPISFIWEYIILGIVNIIVHKIVFSYVGLLYDRSIIAGSILGRIAYWLLAAILFFIVWAILYGAIWVANILF